MDVGNNSSFMHVFFNVFVRITFLIFFSILDFFCLTLPPVGIFIVFSIVDFIANIFYKSFSISQTNR